MHHAHVYRQLRSVLLDDVPDDAAPQLAPFRHPTDLALMVSILLIAVLYPLSLMTEGGNIFLTLIVKSIIFFCIFGCYIQLTGEYDITGKAKSIINKNKR
ncbi:hypothetical protein ACIXN2_03875 [Bacteroides fragilis]